MERVNRKQQLSAWVLLSRDSLPVPMRQLHKELHAPETSKRPTRRSSRASSCRDHEQGSCRDRKAARAGLAARSRSSSKSVSGAWSAVMSGFGLRGAPSGVGIGSGVWHRGTLAEPPAAVGRRITVAEFSRRATIWVVRPAREVDRRTTFPVSPSLATVDEIRWKRCRNGVC
jgi:hypothetical protein